MGARWNLLQLGALDVRGHLLRVEFAGYRSRFTKGPPQYWKHLIILPAERQVLDSATRQNEGRPQFVVRAEKITRVYQVK